MVTISFFLLKFLQCQFKIFHILFDNIDFSLHSFLISSHGLSLSFSINQSFLCLFKSNFSVSFQGSSLGLPLLVLAKISLLRFKLLGQGYLFFLNCNISSLKCFGNIQSFLICTISSISLLLKNLKLFLKVDLTNKGLGLLDDNEPAP